MESRRDFSALTASSTVSVHSAVGTQSGLPSSTQNLHNTWNSVSFFGVSALSRFMAIPWMLDRAGAFGVFKLPERIDGIFGSHFDGSIIAEATGNKTYNLSSTTVAGLGGVQETAAPLQEHAAGATGRFFSYASLQHVRSFGGIFTYLTSKWAFACLTLVSHEKSYAQLQSLTEA